MVLPDSSVWLQVNGLRTLASVLVLAGDGIAAGKILWKFSIFMMRVAAPGLDIPTEIIWRAAVRCSHRKFRLIMRRRHRSAVESFMLGREIKMIARS